MILISTALFRAVTAPTATDQKSDSESIITFKKKNKEGKLIKASLHDRMKHTAFPVDI